MTHGSFRGWELSPDRPGSFLRPTPCWAFRVALMVLLRGEAIGGSLVLRLPAGAGAGVVPGQISTVGERRDLLSHGGGRGVFLL